MTSNSSSSLSIYRISAESLIRRPTATSLALMLIGKFPSRSFLFFAFSNVRFFFCSRFSSRFLSYAVPFCAKRCKTPLSVDLDVASPPLARSCNLHLCGMHIFAICKSFLAVVAAVTAALFHTGGFA